MKVEIKLTAGESNKNITTGSYFMFEVKKSVPEIIDIYKQFTKFSLTAEESFFSVDFISEKQRLTPALTLDSAHYRELCKKIGISDMGLTKHAISKPRLPKFKTNDPLRHGVGKFAICHASGGTFWNGLWREETRDAELFYDDPWCSDAHILMMEEQGIFEKNAYETVKVNELYYSSKSDFMKSRRKPNPETTVL